MNSPLNRSSLRTQLILNIVFCWVLPVLIVAAGSSYILYSNYAHHMNQELDLAGSYAFEQINTRFDTVLFESKTVSYDGVVRNAYRTYQTEQDSASLYRSVSNYMNQRFSRRESVSAMFISFWNEPGMIPYISNQEENSSRVIISGYTEIEASILEDMADADTKVRLYVKNSQLYAARNLLDSRLKPYATVVIQCSIPYLADPLKSLSAMCDTRCEIDEIAFGPDGTLISDPTPEKTSYIRLFSGEFEGHSITLFTRARALNFLNDVSEMSVMITVVSILVTFLLASLLWFFTRRISRPVRTLMEATGRVREGERGYMITGSAGSREFDTLYHHFNAMSEELKHQFDRAMEEQETLHQARIKALQSQINPHFLNNTLEIINWEARIAGNDRITAMIEALATMLSTSLNRNDNPQISFRDELEYTNAYLYIIKERMGERLTVDYDIDSVLYDRMIPRMILQPLVENAIEHDLSRSAGGRLTIRAACGSAHISLCVEHDGHILHEDRLKLDRLLGDSTEPGDRVHIGIRNVSQRLRLLYGDEASLTIEEVEDALIRAEIRLPLHLKKP